MGRFTVEQWLHKDSRGNRIEEFRALRRGDEICIVLRACEEIVEQVELALPDVRRVSPQLWDATTAWTHALVFQNPYRARHLEVLELLSRILTFRPIPELDHAAALDFYSVPPDPDQGRTDFGRTPTGELVYRKYFQGGLDEQVRAGRSLASQLVEVIRAHPTFSSAQRVVSVPGTEHTFGERLAATVAKYLPLPIAHALRVQPPEQPAKQGHTSTELADFTLPSVAGEVVIIIDDVFRSGHTMRGVAASARRAGAARVFGLVATRTLRAR